MTLCVRFGFRGRRFQKPALEPVRHQHLGFVPRLIKAQVIRFNDDPRQIGQLEATVRKPPQNALDQITARSVERDELVDARQKQRPIAKMFDNDTFFECEFGSQSLAVHPLLSPQKIPAAKLVRLSISPLSDQSS